MTDSELEVEVGFNEERRMLGMAGDDADDDLQDDAAPFGFGDNAAINAEDDEEEPPPPPHAAAALPQNSCVLNKGKGKKSTSPVWDDFDKLTRMENGREVRYGAKCKHCGKEYSTFSTGGNGHLSRHIPKCVKKREKDRKSQSQISFNCDGSMRNWEYSPLVARTELVRLIARLNIPIILGDSDDFVEYITNAHNPKYKSVSRQTTTRDITKYFTDKKAKLVLTVYFGTPSMFITLWFGFDYGTNSPLGTLII
jgi:hypothetical protein